MTKQEMAQITLQIKRLDMPSLAERTNLHAAFNAELSAACQSVGIKYFSDFDFFLSPQGDQLDPFFSERHQHPDWHLDFQRASGISCAMLSEALAARMV